MAKKPNPHKKRGSQGRLPRQVSLQLKGGMSKHRGGRTALQRRGFGIFALNNHAASCEISSGKQYKAEKASEGECGGGLDGEICE